MLSPLFNSVRVSELKINGEWEMEHQSTLCNQKDKVEMFQPPRDFRMARSSPHHDSVEETGADVTIQKLSRGRGKLR